MPSHSEVIEMIIAQRDEAQEAAETYHEAWQDAAIYWKADRDRLRAALENALAELLAYRYEAGPEPLPTVMRILARALAEKEAGSSADPASET